MNTRNIAIASFKALAFSVLAFSAQASNLVTNGDFTSITSGVGQLGFNTNATGWTSAVPDGSYNFVFMPGSDVTNGVQGQYSGLLALWTPGNGAPTDNHFDTNNIPGGGNFVAADGGFSGHNGPITQEINNLVIGETYNLRFNWAGAQQYGFTGATTEGWTVSLGSSTQQVGAIDNASHGFTGWQSADLAFKATGTSELLSFLAIGTPNGVPPFTLLSNVSLTTPVPAALFFVAPALAGVFGFSRRKQNKA